MFSFNGNKIIATSGGGMLVSDNEEERIRKVRFWATQSKKPARHYQHKWMLISLTETEARDLLEIIHAYHKRASTIFCSQFAPAGWHKKFSEATIQLSGQINDIFAQSETIDAFA